MTETWRYVDFLLVKQLLFGITNSITERSLKDFDKILIKIVPELGLSGPNRYFDSDWNLNREFFVALDKLLRRLGENKNPALRTINWRAKNLRRHLSVFSKVFPAAK